ncbi:MAG TPA: aldehyde dehydrogenase family protein [Acidimicrobiales bacterium]|jgi:acyl-CoA reductase-like NAD-dependent aldehyde dehydrogenase|nr:aldehyde dehydrogenase family protein [Acidimicrobiales bacterium]
MAEIAEHWIDGQWVDSDNIAESINPATGEVLGQWYDGGEAEARAAIAAAKQAYMSSPWSRDRSVRFQALSEMAERFDAHIDELGRLVTQENGKILADGMFESSTAGLTLRHNAAQTLTEAGICAEVAPGLWFSQYSEPAGVVGIIVPWNGPVALFIRSLAPALAAGNTVAVKMPGQTALVANRLSQIIAEVGSLPVGVVNIFTESGNSGAPYLVASPDVQVISYTGSIAVGRIVAADGAPTLKRMNLELGGKTPMIIFDDADLDMAIPLVASALTTFTGQFCMTGSRILVQRGAADQVRAGLKKILESVRLGDGLSSGTEMGPLIDKPNVARVDGMVEAALAYAKAIVRGGPATEGALANGAFFRPALLEVEDVDSEIVQKEVFGPVATFEVFDTEADAISRANATEMGLAAGIFTESLATSRRVSREIQAGTVWTNTWATLNDGFAEGGYKHSGVGRLRGSIGISEFQEPKTVVHSVLPAAG